MFIVLSVAARATRHVPAAAFAAVLAAAFFCGTLQPAAASIVVDSAEEICAAGADPCVVTAPVDVAAGSRLDFGLRTVRLEGAGSLGFAAGSTQVLCGRLEASGSGAAIRARGVGSAAEVAVQVRGHCASAPQTPCLLESDCSAAGRGSCVGATAVAVLDASILGNAEVPARISLRAAGDIELRKAALLSATRSESDGGSLALESTGGSVLVAAPVDLSGGGGGSGGDFSVLAGIDIAVTGKITAAGGDFDGGTVTLDAGRDIAIGDDIRVDANGGSGAGGEISVTAGGDLALAPVASSGILLVSGDGHQSSDNYGGDGGVASFEADGRIRVGSGVRFSASGAPPDGFADTLSFTACGDIDFDAVVVAKGRGAMGGGGLVEFESDANVRVGAAASFDLTGGGAGGDLVAESLGDLELAAGVDVSGGREGIGGRVVAGAGGDVVVSGAWATDGVDSPFSVGEFLVEGCRVSVSAPLVNSAASGRNSIVAHDSLVVQPQGALLASGSAGTNSVRYRSADKAPRLDGQVTPSAALAVDTQLSACPSCGNTAADGDEGCDDHDFCTVDDTCADGTCRMAPVPSLVVDAFVLKRGRGGDPARATWKASFPASELRIEDQDSNVRVVVADAASRPLVDTTLPASAFVARNGAWKFAADREAAGGAIAKASFRLARSGSVVRALFRLQDAGLAQAAEASSLSLALLFGDEPGSVPCLNSGSLVCDATKRSPGNSNTRRCRAPRAGPPP